MRFFSPMDMMRRSKVLYSSFKHPLPKSFQGTAFRKHAKMLIEEKQTQDTSKLCFVLPSTTDHKEKINNFFGNVNFHPIDCTYEILLIIQPKIIRFYCTILAQEIQLKERLQENLFKTF